MESSPIKQEECYSPGERCQLEDEESEEDAREDLSLREDLAANQTSPSRHETPPNEDMCFEMAVTR